MGSKRAQAERQPPRLTRAAQMKRDGVEPRLPPVSAPHYITMLLEIGLTEPAGMGSGPISWSAIAAWQSVMQINLPRWIARLLRQLSIEYLAEGHRAESENCPPPWRAEVTEREKQVEVQRLQMVLG